MGSIRNDRADANYLLPLIVGGKLQSVWVLQRLEQVKGLRDEGCALLPYSRARARDRPSRSHSNRGCRPSSDRPRHPFHWHLPLQPPPLPPNRRPGGHVRSQSASVCPYLLTSSHISLLYRSFCLTMLRRFCNFRGNDGKVQIGFDRFRSLKTVR